MIRRRLRVLMSAYSCQPNKGSEPGIGWNWAIQAAKDHEVWVVTNASNRDAIETELRQRPIPHLHFIYHALPSWAGWLNHVPFGAQLRYEWWQRSALRPATAAYHDYEFDLSHHITFGTCRTPSYLHRLPIPYIWGPVGGVESSPIGILPRLELPGAAGELLRMAHLVVSRFRPGLRRTVTRAALAVASTQESQAFIQRLGAHHAAIHPAIGHDALEASPSEAVECANGAETIRLLFVGRLVAWKGVSFAVHALACARKRGVAGSLTFIGDGSEARRVMDQARADGVAEYVRVLGWADRDALAAEYRSHDVLLFPSFHDSGGMVVLEAMASRLPVICLDQGGPGMSVSEDCGIKVPVGTSEQIVDELADAILRLASDIELRRRMGQAARRRVLEHYTWDRKREIICEIYRTATREKAMPT